MRRNDLDDDRRRKPVSYEPEYRRNLRDLDYGYGSSSNRSAVAARVPLQRVATSPLRRYDEPPTPNSKYSYRHRRGSRNYSGVGSHSTSPPSPPPDPMAVGYEKYEQPMDPNRFREECRKTYIEASAQRQRNAEMSLWGRCDWATYDTYDARAHNRR